MNTIDQYNYRADKANSLLCVGLDSDLRLLPDRFKKIKHHRQFKFNKWIIDQTAEYVAAFKINMAFYEANWKYGAEDLQLTMEYLHEKYPDIFTICDAKRADIGNTNHGYVLSILDFYGFKGITLHPYLGSEALKPFLDRVNNTSIILCRTSNPGAGELQDLKIDGKPLWQVVAEKVSTEWNKNNNCMLVVGATYPEEMKKIRSLVGDMTFLVPGIGEQGGNVEATVKAGLNSQKKGLIISSSRGIIFAENPAEEAKKLRDEINKYR